MWNIFLSVNEKDDPPSNHKGVLNQPNIVQ